MIYLCAILGLGICALFFYKLGKMMNGQHSKNHLERLLRHQKVQERKTRLDKIREAGL